MVVDWKRWPQTFSPPYIHDLYHGTLPCPPTLLWTTYVAWFGQQDVSTHLENKVLKNVPKWWCLFSPALCCCCEKDMCKLAFWRVRDMWIAWFIPAETSLDQPTAGWVPEMGVIPAKISRPPWLTILDTWANKFIAVYYWGYLLRSIVCQ